MVDARLSGAIELIVEQVEQKERELLDLKRAGNALALSFGEPPPFEIADERASHRGMKIRADQFASFPAQSPAARAFLRLRTKERGSASAEEIHRALKAGGYFFDAKTEEEELRALRISLSKDKKITSLPNGTYGLAAWYGRRSKKRRSRNESDVTDDDSLAAEELDDEDDGFDSAAEVDLDDPPF